MMKKLLTLAALFAVTGCTTIHFDRNANFEEGTTQHKRWHHNMVLALIETSDPVNLEERCQGKEWTSVKTEVSFLNGLAGGAVNSIAPIWYPKTVEVDCK